MTKHVSGFGYVVVFAALLLLATASLLLSFVHWSASGDLVVALVFATVKALLVLFYFMHLVEQRFSNRVTVLVSVGFVALLVGLCAADVASRHSPRAIPPAGDAFYLR
jgi:cytochrome c oxidase subunit 4